MLESLIWYLGFLCHETYYVTQENIYHWKIKDDSDATAPGGIDTWSAIIKQKLLCKIIWDVWLWIIMKSNWASIIYALSSFQSWYLQIIASITGLWDPNYDRDIRSFQTLWFWKGWPWRRYLFFWPNVMKEWRYQTLHPFDLCRKIHFSMGYSIAEGSNTLRVNIVRSPLVCRLGLKGQMNLWIRRGIWKILYHFRLARVQLYRLTTKWIDKLLTSTAVQPSYSQPLYSSWKTRRGNALRIYIGKSLIWRGKMYGWTSVLNLDYFQQSRGCNTFDVSSKAQFVRSDRWIYYPCTSSVGGPLLQIY